MLFEILREILIPLLGTTLGAACVFFVKKELNRSLQRALTGFAAGVMVCASVFSLLIPAIEQSESMGKLAFIPAVTGFGAGQRCGYGRNFPDDPWDRWAFRSPFPKRSPFLFDW